MKGKHRLATAVFAAAVSYFSPQRTNRCGWGNDCNDYDDYGCNGNEWGERPWWRTSCTSPKGSSRSTICNAKDAWTGSLHPLPFLFIQGWWLSQRQCVWILSSLQWRRCVEAFQTSPYCTEETGRCRAEKAHKGCLHDSDEAVTDDCLDCLDCLDGLDWNAQLLAVGPVGPRAPGSSISWCNARCNGPMVPSWCVRPKHFFTAVIRGGNSWGRIVKSLRNLGLEKHGKTIWLSWPWMFWSGFWTYKAQKNTSKISLLKFGRSGSYFGGLNFLWLWLRVSIYKIHMAVFQGDRQA